MRSPAGLILPDDCAELFIVTWDAQATESEIDKAIALNGAASDWLEGKIETDTYLDQVAETVYDPYRFLDYVDNLLPANSGVIYL